VRQIYLNFHRTVVAAAVEVVGVIIFLADAKTQIKN